MEREEHSSVERSTNPFDLEAKVAIVTGGASGIGAGIAAVLAEAGAIVVIADRDEAGARRVAATLKEAGRAPRPVHVDLADETSIVRACAEVISRYGAPWLLVNNAGVQDRELLLESTRERMGPHERDQCARSFPDDARDRAGHGGGRPRRADRQYRIGRVGGISHQRLGGLFRFQGRPPRLEPRKRVRARRFAITVNTVLPGGVATPGAIGAKGPAAEGPARRRPPLGTCEPGDIGAAVLFFASPAARYITNQVLTVDGGWSVT